MGAALELECSSLHVINQTEMGGSETSGISPHGTTLLEGHQGRWELIKKTRTDQMSSRENLPVEVSGQTELVGHY